VCILVLPNEITFADPSSPSFLSACSSLQSFLDSEWSTLIGGQIEVSFPFDEFMVVISSGSQQLTSGFSGANIGMASAQLGGQ
jgi:hypothetical protein